MLQHRCPWCGETIPFKDTFANAFRKYKEPNVCPSCQKGFQSYSKWLGLCLAIAIVPVISLFTSSAALSIKQGVLSKNFLPSLLILLLLLIVIFLLLRLPLRRDVKEGGAPLDSKPAAKVTILWEKKRQGGFRLPRFQVLNGEVFPACFMDPDGTPISHPLCVALKKIHWLNGFHCACSISLILDNVPEDTLLISGNQFFLYHDYQKIAKGVIKQ